MKKFAEQNVDLLQNIEYGIVDVYRSDPLLIDIDVQEALNALARHYHAEEEQRTPPALRLSDRAQRVFASVQEMCEWRLGKGMIDGHTVTAALPVSDIVRALREVGNSVPRWSRQGGRKGYLNFVSQYIR